eukprot:136475_1
MVFGQLSKIKNKSTSPTNNTTSTTPQSMYIHMKIGLKTDLSQKNESKTDTNKPSTTGTKFSKSDSNINEEEKSTSQIAINNSAPSSVSGDLRPIPRPFSSLYSHSMTMPPYYPLPPKPYLHRRQSTPNPNSNPLPTISS